MRNEIVYGWHFLPADRKLRHNDGRIVVAGETLSSTVGAPVLCDNGMHSSIELSDALVYAPGPVLCRVASWGDIVEDNDKMVAQHRRVLWMFDATNLLRTHAAWCAQWALEQELSHGHDVDERSSTAVDVAFAFAEGDATRDQWAAASNAAWAATSNAARAAASNAAWAAARSIFAGWLVDAALDEAKELGVFVDDVDPRGEKE